MMQQIDQHSLISKIIFLLLLVTNICVCAQNDSIRRKKLVLALEICNKNYFNLCSNDSPLSYTKIPEFVNYNEKTQKVTYDTIYRYPPVGFNPQYEGYNPIELFDYFDEPKVVTDTLKVKLSKVSVKNIKKTLKKNTYRSKLKNDGCLYYLIYSLDINYIYAGEYKTYVINEEKGDDIIERIVKVFYIIEILECQPGPSPSSFLCKC